MPTFKVQTKVQERFCFETRPDPCGMVVFGASGDLAHRKLFPALFRLRRANLLPKNFFLLGVGRTRYSDSAFRDHVLKSLGSQARNPEEKSLLAEFLAGFFYHAGDYADLAAYQALSEKLQALDKARGTGGNRMFHLAVPPSVYETVVQRLGAAGLSRERDSGRGWSRLIVEKPFGRDQASAHRLNFEVQRVFSEEQTYRIDHYLGKETVQSIMVLRFANLLFEPVWNRNFVDHVQITAAETAGVGHRAGYYDQSGALRDMFQSHLLQLLCISAMEPPNSFQANRVRDEKSKVLRAVRPLASAGDSAAVRGQYGPGVIDGQSVPGYRQEPGMNSQSPTETFAALKIFVDNWRWQGVPFYLRSGKRLAKRLTEIAVQFKHVPHLLFEPLRPQDLGANVLVLRIQPEEGVSLTFETKHPGPKLCMSSVTMDFNYESSFGELPEAYERLFLDCMAGDQTLFDRADWVHMSWSLLDPLLDAWKKTTDPVPIYPAGSWGPAAADDLLAGQGHAWRNG